MFDLAMILTQSDNFIEILRTFNYSFLRYHANKNLGRRDGQMENLKT